MRRQVAFHDAGQSLPEDVPGHHVPLPVLGLVQSGAVVGNIAQRLQLVDEPAIHFIREVDGVRRLSVALDPPHERVLVAVLREAHNELQGLHSETDALLRGMLLLLLLLLLRCGLGRFELLPVLLGDHRDAVRPDDRDAEGTRVVEVPHQEADVRVGGDANRNTVEVALHDDAVLLSRLASALAEQLERHTELGRDLDGFHETFHLPV